MQLCSTPLWDPDLTWNTENPDFTPCFHKTVLIYGPVAFIILFLPLEIYYISTSRKRNTPYTVWNISRLVITALLTVLSLTELGLVVGQDEDFLLVDVLDPVGKTFTYSVALLLMVANMRSGLQTSGVLFSLFFILSVFQSCTLASVVRFGDEIGQVFNSKLFYTEYTFILLVFLSLFWADPSPSKISLDEVDDKLSSANASFPSRITFTYFDAIIRMGWKSPLTLDNLPKLSVREKCSQVFPKWNKNWMNSVKKNEKKGKDTSILLPLFKTFGLLYLSSSFIQLLVTLLQQVTPQILSYLISFISSNEEEWKGFLYMFLLVTINLLTTILNSQYFRDQQIIGIRMKSALTCSLFRKSLRLSSKSRKELSVGDTVNLMSIDTQRLMDVIMSLNLLWSGPLSIVLSIYSLWGYLGPSSLAGLLVMILIIPANAWISSKMKKYQILNMKNKDNRMKAMNEVLDGVKVLKLYAWEPSFEQQICDIRFDEVENLKRMSYLGAIQTFIFNSTPFFVALASFTTFVLSNPNNVLDAEKAFVSISFFNIIRRPLNQLPNLVTQMISATVSLDRLNKYLNAAELDPSNISHYDDQDDIVIKVQNGNLTWDKDDEPFLKDIKMSIKKGELVAIVGQVGAGKSSLLSALIGDMEKASISTEINVLGQISYVPQQAWMQNASLQYNITFGRNYNEKLYDKVVDACALTPDFEILPNKDLTEIGEKGINLSGGQKQRVSMARAVYNNGDIYLLDDPLSAVDSHVGRHIFDKVIGSNGLLKNKTRILVTHSVKFLPDVDKIIVLKDGRISESGNYKELLEKGQEFADFLIQYIQEEEDRIMDQDKETLDTVKQELEERMGAKQLDSEIKKAKSRSSAGHSNISGYTTGTIEREIQPIFRQTSTSSRKFDSAFIQKVIYETKSRNNHDEKSPLINKDNQHYGSSEGHLANSRVKRENSRRMGKMRGQGDLMTTEKLATKAVEFQVYSFYFKAVGVFTVVAIFLLNVASQALSIGTNVWLSEWSDDPNASDPAIRNEYLGVYGALGTLSALAICLSSLTTAVGGLAASSKLHQNMLTGVLRAPMSFFDTTPKGRIINRFAKDVDYIDKSIPFTFSALLRLGFGVIGTIAVISFTNPIFIAIFIPLSVVYWLVQKIYVATSRQLRRLESSSRSPIYSWFGEAISGVSTIKAYGIEDRFFQEMAKNVDVNQSCMEPNIVSNRWLSIRLEMLGNLIILFAALFAILGRDSLDPGIVGLSLSYAMQITVNLNFLIRQTSQIENNMVSVERIKEYQTGLPQEAAWLTENDPKGEWPSRGEVYFKSYETRYREGLDLVLKGVDLLIPPGQKIGVVGRTGAGKSSLTLSLFRIIEAVRGKIEIDGVDVSTIGLGALRSKITIMPQDPVLFSGTLRMNLDPFGEKSDLQLWRALELAHLSTYIKSLSQGLDYMISEGGDNLSVGQRQLVCLARALLRKTKILVLDEATAAVDLETDDLIQATIRSEFTTNTIITIAHRINTIMDSDLVVVLSDGKIVEQGNPLRLLEEPNSKFAQMALEAGIQPKAEPALIDLEVTEDNSVRDENTGDAREEEDEKANNVGVAGVKAEDEQLEQINTDEIDGPEKKGSQISRRTKSKRSSSRGRGGSRGGRRGGQRGDGGSSDRQVWKP